MKAELPANEILRLKALHDLAILDSPREQNFDDLAQIAMQLCDTPIAVVSLIDTDRQWFKSCLGLDATETSRDVAFCAHAILGPQEILIVEDATKDKRFSDNPAVISDPHIRFYAGAPLVTEDGMALGTLCVVDYKPRSLNEGQKSSLKALARQIIQLLKLKSINTAVQQYSNRVQIIADKVPVLIGELTRDYRYTFANQKHKDWLSVEDCNLFGKTPADIFPAHNWDNIRNAIDISFSGLKTHIEISLLDGRVLDINYLPHSVAGEVVSVFEVATDVTVQKINLQSLQHEQARLEAIIEGTNLGVWEWDNQTNYVTVNERWVTMLGYALAELQPITLETWRRLLHPDDVEPSVNLLKKHVAGELPFYDCQFRLRKKNGEWKWIHSHGKVVRRNPDGSAAITSGMHTDINDIKTTYNRLKESEDLMRSLLSNFPGAAYRREDNPSWTMHYLSDAVEQLTGYPAENFINNNQLSFNNIRHPVDIERVTEAVESALTQRRSFDIEYRIKRADGQWRYVQEIGRGVFDDQGKIRFIDGFIWDIQARIDDANEKRIMDTKLAQLFEMAPIGIIQAKQSGDIIEIVETNPEFNKMIGYTNVEIKAMNFIELTPQEDVWKTAVAINSLKTKGQFGPIEKKYRHKDGELIPVEISGSLINSNDDTYQSSWWTLVKDIREQKHMERMKSEFISTVSHELRTPLTSISGALGLITNNMLGVIPEKAKAILDIAYKNSQRLSYLIDDLLDMEKLIAGKMSFDLSVQTVTPLIQQAITENKSYADKYLVTFVLDDSAPGSYINIDAFRLQQVLNNFLSNAAKYSPPQAQVKIMVSSRDAYLRISVHDCGAGIPEEFKSRMFQKFSQADSSDTRQKGGTGLGLAISKELVERMDGRIGFKSEPDKGTYFFAEFKAVSGIIS